MLTMQIDEQAIAREYGRFVGDRIDENDKPVGEDYKYVLNK